MVQIMPRHVTRRRFIAITAAAAGLELLPLQPRAQPRGDLAVWRGVALGAVATLQIYHPDRTAAERLIARSVAEVHRLERIFSLYREDSILALLNRAGFLEAPPAELVELLRESLRYAELTHGAFDPTVQPLWRLYARHFSHPGADPNGPPLDAVEAALETVGLDKALIGHDRLAFTRPGMELTLNGIAQGYITDRVVTVLGAEGIDHSLIDMGEIRAIGARPDEHPWEVGITDPDNPEQIAEAASIVDCAVATSGGYGFRFDAQGRFTHLFDPSTGRSPHRYRSITAIMPTATAADALSTAFAAMPVDDIRGVLKALGHGQVRLATAEGRRVVLEP
jgi:thiamine biosynthesis lipoprotein